jgi:hypothetical protein
LRKSFYTRSADRDRRSGNCLGWAEQHAGSRMQLAAIARVRWQLFVHSLRTTRELWSFLVASSSA